MNNSSRKFYLKVGLIALAIAGTMGGGFYMWKNASSQSNVSIYFTSKAVPQDIAFDADGVKSYFEIKEISADKLTGGIESYCTDVTDIIGKRAVASIPEGTPVLKFYLGLNDDTVEKVTYNFSVTSASVPNGALVSGDKYTIRGTKKTQGGTTVYENICHADCMSTVTAQQLSANNAYAKFAVPKASLDLLDSYVAGGSIRFLFGALDLGSVSEEQVNAGIVSSLHGDYSNGSAPDFLNETSSLEEGEGSLNFWSASSLEFKWKDFVPNRVKVDFYDEANGDYFKGDGTSSSVSGTYLMGASLPERRIDYDPSFGTYSFTRGAFTDAGLYIFRFNETHSETTDGAVTTVSVDKTYNIIKADSLAKAAAPVAFRTGSGVKSWAADGSTPLEESEFVLSNGGCTMVQSTDPLIPHAAVIDAIAKKKTLSSDLKALDAKSLGLVMLYRTARIGDSERIVSVSNAAEMASKHASSSIGYSFYGAQQKAYSDFLSYEEFGSDGKTSKGTGKSLLADILADGTSSESLEEAKKQIREALSSEAFKKASASVKIRLEDEKALYSSLVDASQKSSASSDRKTKADCKAWALEMLRRTFSVDPMTLYGKDGYSYLTAASKEAMDELQLLGEIDSYVYFADPNTFSSQTGFSTGSTVLNDGTSVSRYSSKLRYSISGSAE